MPKLHKAEPTSVLVLLSERQTFLLDRLVRAGVLGTSRPEIFRYLLIREIEKQYPEEVKGRDGIDGGG